jgi:hypothetical protein
VLAVGRPGSLQYTAAYRAAKSVDNSSTIIITLFDRDKGRYTDDSNLVIDVDILCVIQRGCMDHCFPCYISVGVPLRTCYGRPASRCIVSLLFLFPRRAL